MSDFISLHNHSHYSVGDGLSKVDEMVKAAKMLGYDALALTDHGSVSGLPEFEDECKKQGIKSILGCESYISAQSGMLKERVKDTKGDTLKANYHLTLIAKNLAGYKTLVKLATKSYELYYYRQRIDKETLAATHDGLICLSGCPSSELSNYILKGEHDNANSLIGWYKELFGDDYYLEIQNNGMVDDMQRTITKFNIEASKKFGIPLVATVDSHYIRKEDRKYHIALKCISMAKKLEGQNVAFDGDYHIYSYQEMLNTGLPKESITNTVVVAEKVERYSLFSHVHAPLFYADADATLEQKCKEKLAKFTDRAYYERFAYELSVIKKMKLSSYFLIIHDIISWARNANLAVGPGRGSASGSLICYLLEITLIDPLKYNIMFERFLNPDRVTIPDIDCDVGNKARVRVLEYIKNRFGNMAHIMAFNYDTARAVIRDTCRIMDIPMAESVAITKTMMDDRGVLSLDDAIEQEEFKNAISKLPVEKSTQLLDISRHLENTIRNASIHAAGIIISDKDISDILPLCARDGVVKTQYTMEYMERLGFNKIDILGLKTIDVIWNTLQKIGKKYEDIPLDDPNVFSLLKEGRIEGIFQMEGQKYKEVCMRFAPQNFTEVTHLVAIYRPGPIDNGDLEKYIRRKWKSEAVTYLHPSLEPILKSTQGTCLFQDQVMEIVKTCAGFSMAEADEIRKAMGKKDAAIFMSKRDEFMARAEVKGYDFETRNAIWDSIVTAAGYSWNVAHATSYAMITYWTAYLSANYPAYFFTELMNTYSDDFEKRSTYIDTIKGRGIAVNPPDINVSGVLAVTNGSEVVFGLSFIKGIGEKLSEVVISERGNGLFLSVGDFRSRIPAKTCNKNHLALLEKSGCFASINGSKPTSESEYELLGEYLSAHPLIDWVGIQYTFKRADNYEASTVVSLVRNVHSVITKKNQKMAFVTLEDPDRQKVSVVCFPQQWASFKSLFQSGSRVFASVSLKKGSYILNSAQPLIEASETMYIDVADLLEAASLYNELINLPSGLCRLAVRHKMQVKFNIYIDKPDAITNARMMDILGRHNILVPF